MTQLISVKIRVFGTVQGVFFRHSAKKKAEELNITGFVRNESDGSVYIEAEGRTDDIQDLLLWCNEGPEFAAVEGITHSYGGYFGKFQNFEIQ